MSKKSVKNLFCLSLLISAILSACSSAPIPQPTAGVAVSEAAWSERSSEPTIEDLLTERALAQVQGLEVYGVKALTQLLNASASQAVKAEVLVTVQQAAKNAGIKLIPGKNISQQVSRLSDEAANKIIQEVFQMKPSLAQQTEYAQVKSSFDKAIASRAKTKGSTADKMIEGAEFRNTVKQARDVLVDHPAQETVVKSQIGVMHHTGITLIPDAKNTCLLLKKFDSTALNNNLKLYRQLYNKAREIGNSALPATGKGKKMLDEGACTIGKFLVQDLGVLQSEAIETAEILAKQCKSYNPAFVEAMKSPGFSQSCPL